MSKHDTNWAGQAKDLPGNTEELVLFLQAHIGWGGVGAAAVIAAMGLLWWHWDEIRKRPGIEAFLLKFSPPRWPRLQSGKLNIAVLHLDNDSANHDSRRLILDALHDFEGVAALPIERILRQNSGANGNAQSLLRKIGADVLLWGSVLRVGSNTAVRLHWTPSESAGAVKQSEKYLLSVETVTLPPLFFADLIKLLGLLVESRLSSLHSALTGHYAVNRLLPRIQEIEDLLRQPRERWDANALLQVQATLANALTICGIQAGNNGLLEEAMMLYRQILVQYTRQSAPLKWAMTQNNLGIALRTLAEREASTTRLQEPSPPTVRR